MKRSLTSFALAALFLTGIVMVPDALGQGTPSLSTLSPNTTVAGGPGFTLTVTGSGFVANLFNGSAVEWNGTGLSTSPLNTNQLTAFVPASLIATAGTVTITVGNPGGLVSNSLTFTITPGPTQVTETSLSPSAATPGGSAFTITVNGFNFVSGAAVAWNGAALSTTFISANQVTAYVPANLIASAGNIGVTVTNPGGAVSNSLTFIVGTVLKPALSSLSPNFTLAGGAAFTLSVNGTGFTSGAQVMWNGAALSTNFVSSDQVLAFVPSNLIASQGAVNVTVVNPGGAASNGLTFTVSATSTPTLTGLSPNATASGGLSFTLTVNGSGFVSGSVVQWNNSTLVTTYISANQLTAFVPATLIAAQGVANVTVVNSSGGVSNGLAFTTSPNGTPTLLSLSPTFSAAGGSAFTLTVNGSGFQNGAVVEWNGTNLSTGFVSPSQLSAFVPAGLIASPGTANITAVNPGTFISNTLTFAIGPTAAPTAISLIPNSAVAGGSAFTLTVSGTGFVNGAVVLWNGSALSTGFSSGNQLSAFVPAALIAAPGSANLTVVNPNGASSNPLTLTINPATSTGPTLFSVSPNATAAGGPGVTLTVVGSGFLNGAVVQWNGTALATNFSGSGTQLTAAVPSYLTATGGTVNITVVNPNGPVSNSLPFSIFSYSSALRIAQIADGASWTTSFQIVNLDVVPVNYSFRFWDDNGNPLLLPFVSGAPGTFSGTLAVGATAFAQTPGTAAGLTEGWAEAASSGRIGVLTIFKQSVPGRPDSEGTVIGIQSGSRIYMPFDNTNGYVTGVAVANTNATQALFIPLLFQLENGTQMTGSLSVPAHAHTSFVLTTMFPSLAGVRGSIEFAASTPDIAVIGLRFSPTNSFTSLGAFQ